VGGGIPILRSSVEIISSFGNVHSTQVRYKNQSPLQLSWWSTEEN